MVCCICDRQITASSLTKKRWFAFVLFIFLRVERNIGLSWLSYFPEMKVSNMSSLSCLLVGPVLCTYLRRQTTYTQTYVESMT